MTRLRVEKVQLLLKNNVTSLIKSICMRWLDKQCSRNSARLCSCLNEVEGATGKVHARQTSHREIKVVKSKQENHLRLCRASLPDCWLVSWVTSRSQVLSGWCPCSRPCWRFWAFCCGTWRRSWFSTASNFFVIMAFKMACIQIWGGWSVMIGTD